MKFRVYIDIPKNMSETNENVFSLMEGIENIKQKITDQEYKTLLEFLSGINKDLTNKTMYMVSGFIPVSKSYIETSRCEECNHEDCNGAEKMVRIVTENIGFCDIIINAKDIPLKCIQNIQENILKGTQAQYNWKILNTIKTLIHKTLNINFEMIDTDDLVCSPIFVNVGEQVVFTKFAKI